MTVAFTEWPEELAFRYRKKGYWEDRPLFDILDKHFRERPKAIALVDGERFISYAQLMQLSDSLGAHLQEKGLKVGDTALVQLENSADFYIVFFALLKIGVVPVNALFSHRQHELSSYADQIKPSLLIASAQHPVFEDLSFINYLKACNPTLTIVMKDMKPAEGSLESLLNRRCSRQITLSPTGAGQVAFFQLSGGSTGTPKLIPRTHNDYLYSIRQSVEVCGITSEDRFLCALPAAHNFPLSSPGALGFFLCGASVVMAATPEPLDCFKLIERHAITHLALVPPAVALWIRAALNGKPNLRSLRLMQVGGASFSEHVARQVPEVFGCKLQQVFGMAEGLVCYTRLDDQGEDLFASQGLPMSEDDEILILDRDGNEVLDGTVGTLATRGPYTIRGYYLSECHNTRIFDREGFYHSGDLVRRTPQGHLQVVGRVKDQINRGGEKIAAEEVERLLLSHPQITHAALVAYEDPLMGEKSCAVLVCSEPMSLPGIRRYLRNLGVAEYKLPDRIKLIECMPLTAVGKINKIKLKNHITE